MRPDFFREPGLVHPQQFLQPEIPGHSRGLLVRFKLPGQPGGVSGADVLAAVATVNVHPHRRPHLPRGQPAAEIGEKRDAAARIDLLRPPQRPRGTGGQTGVPAPVGAADFECGLIRRKGLIHHHGDREDPGAAGSDLSRIEEAVLAERPQSRSRRRQPVGQMEGDLGIDSMVSQKRAERLNPFSQAFPQHPVVVEIAAAEVAFQRSRKGLPEISLHQNDDRLRPGKDVSGIGARNQVEARRARPPVLLTPLLQDRPLGIERLRGCESRILKPALNGLGNHLFPAQHAAFLLLQTGSCTKHLIETRLSPASPRKCVSEIRSSLSLRCVSLH